MNPFYYKGILFNEETSDFGYAYGVDTINALSNALRSECGISRLSDNGVDYDLTYNVNIEEKYDLVVEITTKNEMYSFFNWESMSFEDVNLNDIMHLTVSDFQNAQRMSNRYFTAMERGELAPKANLLQDDIAQQWEMRKFDIQFQIEADVIDKTIDGDFLKSYDNHIQTPQELHEAVQDTLKHRHDMSYGIEL